MTHFSDGVRVGAGLIPQQGNNRGMPVSPEYRFAVTPIAAGLASLAAAQTVTGAAYTLTAISGVTTSTINGVTYYDLGMQRGLQVSGVVSAVAALHYVSGLDDYLRPVTMAFTGPTGTAIVNSPKTIRYVKGISTVGNTTSNVSIGPNDRFGFPLVVSNWDECIVNWAGSWMTGNAGFSGADTTDPATSATNDPRGSWSAPVGTPSNASRRLAMIVWPADPNTNTGLVGVPSV